MEVWNELNCKDWGRSGHVDNPNMTAEENAKVSSRKCLHKDRLSYHRCDDKDCPILRKIKENG